MIAALTIRRDSRQGILTDASSRANKQHKNTLVKKPNYQHLLSESPESPKSAQYNLDYYSSSTLGLKPPHRRLRRATATQTPLRSLIWSQQARLNRSPKDTSPHTPSNLSKVEIAEYEPVSTDLETEMPFNIMSKKYSLNKKLPPKPPLRSGNSPDPAESRSLLDATDLTSSSLQYPLLRPKMVTQVAAAETPSPQSFIQDIAFAATSSISQDSHIDFDSKVGIAGKNTVNDAVTVSYPAKPANNEIMAPSLKVRETKSSRNRFLHNQEKFGTGNTPDGKKTKGYGLSIPSNSTHPQYSGHHASSIRENGSPLPKSQRRSRSSLINSESSSSVANFSIVSRSRTDNAIGAFSTDGNNNNASSNPLVQSADGNHGMIDSLVDPTINQALIDTPINAAVSDGAVHTSDDASINTARTTDIATDTTVNNDLTPTSYNATITDDSDHTDADATPNNSVINTTTDVTINIKLADTSTDTTPLLRTSTDNVVSNPTNVHDDDPIQAFAQDVVDDTDEDQNATQGDVTAQSAINQTIQNVAQGGAMSRSESQTTMGRRRRIAPLPSVRFARDADRLILGDSAPYDKVGSRVYFEGSADQVKPSRVGRSTVLRKKVLVSKRTSSLPDSPQNRALPPPNLTIKGAVKETVKGKGKEKRQSVIERLSKPTVSSAAHAKAAKESTRKSGAMASVKSAGKGIKNRISTMMRTRRASIATVVADPATTSSGSAPVAIAGEDAPEDDSPESSDGASVTHEFATVYGAMNTEGAAPEQQTQVDGSNTVGSAEALVASGDGASDPPPAERWARRHAIEESSLTSIEEMVAEMESALLLVSAALEAASNVEPQDAAEVGRLAESVKSLGEDITGIKKFSILVVKMQDAEWHMAVNGATRALQARASLE